MHGDAACTENRVRYFRLHGHHQRWAEELAILGAEFGRAERHFTRMQEIWLLLAQTADVSAQASARKTNDARVRIQAETETASWLQQPVEELMEEWDRRGAAAYARKKASFYNALSVQTVRLRSQAAATCDTQGSWAVFDAEGERLWSFYYMLKRRGRSRTAGETGQSRRCA